MMSHEHQIPKIDSLHDEKWWRFIKNKLGHFVIKKLSQFVIQGLRLWKKCCPETFQVNRKNFSHPS